MKIVSGLLIIMLSTLLGMGQKIEIFENKVFMDDKHILGYQFVSPVEASIYSLDSVEILSLRFLDNGTANYTQDDYFMLSFFNQKQRVESTNLALVVQGVGIQMRKNMEKLLQNLVRYKVMLEDGSMDEDFLEKFVIKYDENITQRTIRY